MIRPRDKSVNYKAPPVVEVAMSIQFDPPNGFSLPHLGLYWDAQRNMYPTVRTAAPIPAAPDDFGTESQWGPVAMRLAFSNEPQYRLQMTSKDDEWVCQAQLDRLVVNWRKKGPDYPKFDATFPRFQAAWTGLQRFLERQHLAAATPKLWEITYINRFPKGELWQSPKDWPILLPGLWGGAFASASDLTLSTLGGQWVWEHGPERARLYVEPSPARSADTPPVDSLILSLTARGPINVKMWGEDAIESGLNLGHDLIVLTFDAITSKHAKEHWQHV